MLAPEHQWRRQDNQAAYFPRHRVDLVRIRKPLRRVYRQDCSFPAAREKLIHAGKGVNRPDCLASEIRETLLKGMRIGHQSVRLKGLVILCL